MDEVCFCFYGQVKNYSEDILEHFNKNVFNPICDFFQPNKVFKYLVTFNNKEIYNPRNNENSKINYLSIFDYISFDEYRIIDVESEDIKKLDQVSIELVKRFGGSWGLDSLYSTKYAARQLYSLNLLKKFKSKKINVMIRPDLKFIKKISIKNVNIKNYDLLIPSFLTNRHYCNDRFAICLNNKSFESYCGRLENFLLLEQTYNSEAFLMKQLKKDNINFAKIDIKFIRIRANQEIEPRDFYLCRN